MLKSPSPLAFIRLASVLFSGVGLFCFTTTSALSGQAALELEKQIRPLLGVIEAGGGEVKIRMDRKLFGQADVSFRLLTNVVKGTRPIQPDSTTLSAAYALETVRKWSVRQGEALLRLVMTNTILRASSTVMVTVVDKVEISYPPRTGSTRTLPEIPIVSIFLSREDMAKMRRGQISDDQLMQKARIFHSPDIYFDGPLGTK